MIRRRNDASWLLKLTANFGVTVLQFKPHSRYCNCNLRSRLTIIWPTGPESNSSGLYSGFSKVKRLILYCTFYPRSLHFCQWVHSFHSLQLTGLRHRKSQDCRRTHIISDISVFLTKEISLLCLTNVNSGIKSLLTPGSWGSWFQRCRKDKTS